MPQKVTIKVTVVVAPAPPPPPPTLVATPDTVALPDETVGVAVPSTQLSQVTGGTPPYSYTPNGTVPDGLGLGSDENGNVFISGTPTIPGSYSFNIDVADSGA